MLLALAVLAPAARGSPAPDKFGIYTANLDGTNMKRIISDPWREMTHNRVSPDHRWITFSRYNNRSRDGLATEEGGGYENTEVMIARIDGSEVRSVVPPRPGFAAVNSYWTPDGKGLVYLVLTDKKTTEVRFLRFDAKMEVESTSTLKLPANFLPVDPHQVGDVVVFPAVDLETKTRGLWLAQAGGDSLRRITLLKDPKSGKPVVDAKAGENDPKLSPDGAKVAFMRYVPGRGLWHTFVIDLATGEEKDLSAGFIKDSKWEMEGIPEWSSDGKLLVVWHTDLRTNERDFYTMRPDGGGRRKVPLAQFEGERYHEVKGPAFFPGTGSGAEAKIIFNAKTVPRAELRDSPVKKLIKSVILSFM